MTDSAVVKAARRSWLCPHASSIFVAACAAIALGFWNLAGRRGSGKWHFGWPFEYATCDRFGLGVTEPNNWWQSFLWQNDNVSWEFSRLLLVLDAAACVALVVIAATAFELWRRQRRRLWQIYLRELLVLCTLIAIALGVWASAISEARRTETSISQMTFGKGGGVSLEHGLPHAIREILPGDRVRPFDRVVSASSGVAGGHFTEEDMRFLATQPYLRFVYAFGASPAGSVAQLKACGRLETIWVTGYLADKDLLAMAEFGRLRELVILYGVLPPRAIEACGRMKHLVTLNLHGRIMGVKTKTGEVIDLSTAEARKNTDGAEWIDADLALLRNLPCLERLDLSGMDLADDTLQSLADIKSLQSLRVANCKFERADLEVLKRTRPDLQIDDYAND